MLLSPLRPATESPLRSPFQARVGGASGTVETLRYGVSSPVTKAQKSAVGSAFYPYLPSHQAGTLTQWSAYFGTGGNFKIAVLRLNGYTWDRVYLSANITAIVGVNTFTAADFGAVSIQVGDIVGWVGTAAQVAYLDADGFGPNTLFMSGDPAASGNVLTHSTTARNWQMHYTVTGVCNPSATLFNEPFDHTGLPWDWEHASSAWTYGGGKATSPVAGLGFSLNYRFGIGNLSTWTWSVDFTFDTSGARFLMATRNAVQNTNGYAIEINSSTGGFVAYRTGTDNGYTNDGSLTSAGSQATGLTFSTATPYRMTISKSFRSTSVTITNIGTPAQTFTWSWSEEDGTVLPTRGFGCGKPAVCAFVGTISVLGTTFTVPTAQPDFLFIGDSISEGSGTTATTQLVSRVVAAARTATLQVSAQGGASTLHAPSRLAAELPHIRPRKVITMIGVNDTDVANWKNKIAGMRDLMTGASTVYVGSVLARAASTNPEVEFNPYIQAQGWATVRFDLAMTNPATGLAADRNAALYYDTEHPNAAGHAAMAARVAVDVPA